MASCSGERYGSGRRRTAFSTLNIAVLIAIASASVAVAAIVKAGLLRSVRSAYRRSRNNSGNQRNGSSGANTSQIVHESSNHAKPRSVPRLRYAIAVDRRRSTALQSRKLLRKFPGLQDRVVKTAGNMPGQRRIRLKLGEVVSSPCL